MRLTCPNCGAQYELPDDVISVAGRDVQCSNCGDTWFQSHPDHAHDPTKDDPPEEDAPNVWAPKDHDQNTDADADADADADDGNDAAQQTNTEGAATERPEHDTAAASAPPVADRPSSPRRPLDPAIADVLRTEATREARARARDSGGLETQPDLGLDDSGSRQRNREARNHMDQLRNHTPQAYDADEGDTASAETDSGSRRDLLPDIEEINSSLRADSAEADASPDPGGGYTHARQGGTGGFRHGFRLIILLALLLLLIYVFAPWLAQKLPALEAVLSDYVDFVNRWRNWLDSAFSQLMFWLDGLSGGSSNGASPG